jgi:hypothetical protein
MAKVSAMECDNPDCNEIGVLDHPKQRAPYAWYQIRVYEEGWSNIGTFVFHSRKCLSSLPRVVQVAEEERREAIGG